MTTPALDSNNDLVIENNKLKVVDGKEAYGIVIASAIKTLEGEIQLNTNKGIPYQRTLWQSRNRADIWEHYVRERILAFDFVSTINSFEYSTDVNGVFKYTIEIATNDGDVTVTESGVS